MSATDRPNASVPVRSPVSGRRFRAGPVRRLQLLPPAPSPKRRGGARQQLLVSGRGNKTTIPLLLPLSVSGRGSGGGVFSTASGGTDQVMSASEAFKAGRLQEAIDAQIQEVRAHPADHGKRLFLFELAAFAGDLDRARRQIDAVKYDDPDR